MSFRFARRHLRLGLVVGAFVVVTGSLHYWVTHSPRFALARIEVSGVTRMTPAEVAYRSGLPRGKNVFGIDTDATADGLRGLPWIKDVRVERSLPNRIDIHIDEEVPRAVLSMGSLYLANREGRAFKAASVELGEARGLPVVTGISREEYLRDRAGAERRAQEAIDLLELYQQTPDRPMIGEVRTDPNRGFELFTYDRALAIVLGRGSREQLEAQLRAFDVTWKALSFDERHHARTVYVDRDKGPARVTVSFAQTS